MGILEDLFGSIAPMGGGEPDIQNPNIQEALKRLLATTQNGVVASNPANLGIQTEAPKAPTEQPKPLVEGQTVRALPAQQTPPERPTAPARSPDAPKEGLDILSRAMGVLLGTPGEATSFLPGGARDQQMQAKNATYNWLTSPAGGGHDHTTALTILSNPSALQTALAQKMGPKGPPQLVEREGPYGQKIQEYWNPQTGKFESADNLRAKPAAAATTTVAPAAGVETVPAAPLGMAPAKAEVGEVPASTAPSRVGPAVSSEGDYVVGNAVAKPPEGYVHKRSEDGKGFLYNKDGRPVFEEKQGVGERAKKRADSDEDERNKALAGVDTIRRIQELSAKLDEPLKRPYTDKFGNRYDTVGDVVGPWAVPSNSPAAGGTTGQMISSITSLPSQAMKFMRDKQAQVGAKEGRYELADTRAAVNELETMLSSLQGSRVKELFGSQNLSDADREAAAKTVGTLTAQDAKALKAQLSVGERDSYARLDKALRNGLVNVEDIPQEVLAKGVALGIIKPTSIKKGK